MDGWLFLIIGFGFVCGYACGWDLILWVGERIWVLGFRSGCVVSGFWVVMVLKVFRHRCVGARIRGLMVAVGFALDVAALALGAGARERSERRREIEKRHERGRLRGER
uniref:Uncharacterized protein n=1 Tax=Fagus sylvatica TaxID=28930 RepID=A0A2N9FQM8_FAGSY